MTLGAIDACCQRQIPAEILLLKDQPTRLDSTRLPQIKVDEVLCLVRHVRTEVAAHNAVPGCVVLLIELLLYEGSNVLWAQRKSQEHGGKNGARTKRAVTHQYARIKDCKAGTGASASTNVWGTTKCEGNLMRKVMR